MSNSSNAMSAKAKAMFGERLNANDYQTLLSKKSISEIAAYLKNESYYSNVLQGINESQIHRGELELLIKQDLFERFSRLIRYGSSNEHGFYRYVVALSEIEQILTCIRSIQADDNISMIAKLPLFLEKSMCFDIRELTQCRTFSQMIEVLKDTEYYEILKPLLLVDEDNFDFVKCETILRNHYYNKVLSIVKNDPTIKSKEEVEEMFKIQIELENIAKIYRLKKYFKSDPNEILKVITPIYLKIPEKKIREYIFYYSADEFLEDLGKSFYGKYIDGTKFIYIEYHIKYIIYQLNKKKLAFTSDPDLVLLTYMALSQTEIQNIVDIIEGVRYKVPQEKISRLLIM